MKILALSILLISSINCASLSTTKYVVDKAKKIPMFAATYEPSTGDSMAWAYKELWNRLEKAGVFIEEIEGLVNPANGEPVWGLTYRGNHHIDIEKNVDINAKFEILCHEAGHLFHNSSVTQAQAEIFAELVGANLSSHYGWKEGAEKSAWYIASYKYSLPVVPFIESDIKWAVRALTGKIEWHVNLESQ